MSNFYVINLKGSQQKIEIGEEIVVDLLDAQEGSKVIFDEVLLSNIDDTLVIGTPNVDNKKAFFEVIKNFKGDKLYVRKFRAKSRYSRKTGFRPNLSLIKLIEVK